MGPPEERKMNKYEEFIEWSEQQGLEFPCTAAQFFARASAFAAGDEEIVNALCEQGIGPGWRDD